jgi:hypothetical protein
MRLPSDPAGERTIDEAGSGSLHLQHKSFQLQRQWFIIVASLPRVTLYAPPFPLPFPPLARPPPPPSFMPAIGAWVAAGRIPHLLLAWLQNGDGVTLLN